MKRCIADFVAKCLNCEKVKVEHQWPCGVVQNTAFSECKWEMDNMVLIIAHLDLVGNIILFGIL